MKYDNIITEKINHALDILLAKHPERTSIGIAIGVMLGFLNNILQPLLKKWNTIIDVSNTSVWGWISIGIVFMHIPTIIHQFRKISIENDSLDQILNLIERGDFTPLEKRQHYRDLIARASKNIAFNKKITEEITKVNN